MFFLLQKKRCVYELHLEVTTTPDSTLQSLVRDLEKDINPTKTQIEQQQSRIDQSTKYTQSYYSSEWTKQQ